MIDVNIKLVPGGIEPKYMSAGAAGLDCHAREGGKLYRPSVSVIGPFGAASIHRVKVPLGFAISLPDGYEAQIRPRSGLGLKHGIHCAHGTVDADYRGELSALLYNLGTEDFTWEAGERICQLVIAPVARVQLRRVDELEATVRGDNGFGSSGR